MPAKNALAAPQFDPGQPRQLPAYFEELEFLFASAGISDSQAKKSYAKRYIPFDDAELWAILPEYSSTVPYEQFKAAVL